MKDTYIIGIDIGGTNFRIGAVNQENEVQYFQKKSVHHIFKTGDALLDLERYLHAYITSYKLTGCIDIIVIGFPAILNRNRTEVLQAPNLKGMEKLPVAEYLEKALGVKVLIEKDVCLTVYYDIEKYQIPKCEILIGCYFGTGVGNVMLINNKILTGSHGTAGELGHIPVSSNHDPCGCGNEGCIENLAGGKYLSKLCQEFYTETAIGEIFTKHGQEELLEKFVDYMAIAVATEINILDPDYVLVGGGVLNMKDFPLERLEERIHVHTRKPYPEQELQIIFTQDEEMKSVVGAAYYGRQKYKSTAGEKYCKNAKIKKENTNKIV